MEHCTTDVLPHMFIKLFNKREWKEMESSGILDFAKRAKEQILRTEQGADDTVKLNITILLSFAHPPRIQ